MTTRHLELFSPTRAQLRYLSSPHQFNVVRFGRQSGKSTAANNKLIKCAWENSSEGVYWYVGPTYRLADQMYWRAKRALGDNAGVIKHKSDSKLSLQLTSSSTIHYLSGDAESSLVGETLSGAVMDECREQKKETWTRIVFPMLGTTKGWGDLLSTPNGMDWFYDMDQKRLLNSNWGSFHAPSHSNPLWSQEMLDEAKESMTEDLYAQEILAEFREMGAGTCYVTFGEHNIRDTSPFAMAGELISPHLPILVGMDFNLSPMCWVLGQHKQRDIYWHDEIYQMRPDKNESPTGSAAKELVRRVKGHKAGVLLIGDASGKAGQRSAEAGQSDYDTIKNILKQAAIHFQDKTPDANPGIKDRVNTANSAFRSADGNVHTWFNPRCKETIKDMRKRAWKDNAARLSFDDSDPLVGHPSDAATYCYSVLAPIKKIGNVSRVRIIQRSI